MERSSCVASCKTNFSTKAALTIVYGGEFLGHQTYLNTGQGWPRFAPAGVDLGMMGYVDCIIERRAREGKLHRTYISRNTTPTMRYLRDSKPIVGNT